MAEALAEAAAEVEAAAEAAAEVAAVEAVEAEVKSIGVHNNPLKCGVKSSGAEPVPRVGSQGGIEESSGWMGFVLRGKFYCRSSALCFLYRVLSQ